MQSAGNINITQFLQLFNQFSKEDQLKIADKILQQTFEEQWLALDTEMPNVEMSEEEIMAEVRVVRYGEEN